MTYLTLNSIIELKGGSLGLVAYKNLVMFIMLPSTLINPLDFLFDAFSYNY